MNGMFDIVASVVIGGVILAMLVAFNGNIAQNSGAQTIKVLTQTNLTEVTNVLEYDFRKMGYLVGSFPDSAIIYADSNRIRFRGDINNDGVVDTVTYYLDTTVASGYANTKTRILRRAVSFAGGISMNLGITRFRLWYYAATDSILTANPVTQPSQIKSLKVAVNIESTVPYKETTMPYLKLNPGVYWERTMKPKNLR